MTDATMTDATAPVDAQSTEAISEIEGNPEAESQKPEQETVKDEPSYQDLLKKLSKQDRRLGRKTAEKYQMRQTISELEEKLSKLSAPKEADFEGKPYDDWRDAKTEHALEKKFIENKAGDIKAQLSESEKAWKEERAQILNDNGDEAAKTFSDFHDVMKQSGRAMAALPAEIKDVFLEADNGAFALYALAKEGALEDLADMSPARAAMIVAKMEDKGLSLSKTKEVSKAPAPLEAVKGTGTSRKDPSQMTDAEFNAWRRASIARKR